MNTRPDPAHAFASWFHRHRRAVAVLVVLATIAAALGATRLRFDVNMRNLFRSNDRRMEVLEELYRNFGTDDDDCIVVLDGTDVFTPESLRVLRAVADGARRLDAVDSVISLADAIVWDAGGAPRPLLPAPGAPPQAYETAREAARVHPLAGGRLVSHDGRTTLVSVRLKDDVDYLAYLRDPANPLARCIEQACAGGPFEASLTGIPVIRAEILTELQRDQIRFLVIGAIVGAAIAFALFRSVVATLLVALPAVTGTLWLIGILGLAGEAINPVNSVIPTLVLIIGFTDAVHMVHAVRVTAGSGATHREASWRVIAEVGPACALTSLTTAVGFASLAAARLDVIERFGVTAAAGAAVSFLAVITIVPLVAGTRFGARVGGIRAHDPDGTGLARRLIRALFARRRLVAAIGVAVTVALAVVSTNLYASAWLREGAPDGSAAGHAIARIDEQFGGILSLMVRVEWDESLSVASPQVLAALEDADRLLRAEPMVTSPLSVLNVLDVLPPPGGDRRAKTRLLSLVPPALAARLIRPDLRQAVITANMPDVGSHLHAPVLARLERELAAVQAESPGVTLTLSGNPVAVGRSADFMIQDLARSLAMAAGVIFAVMVVAFRSLVLGLVSVIPNVFPLVTAGASLVIVGYPLTVTGVITFCVCLGIAVDDTIHVLWRVKRELAEGASGAMAIERAFHVVGAALVTTTMVLVGGFATLLLSDMPMLRLFGALCCVALLAALAGDLVILPVLLASFWRPTRPGKRRSDEETEGRRGSERMRE